MYDRTTSIATPLADLATTDTYICGLSADGRYVAFRSDQAVVPGDTNGHTDVFVLDRTTAAVLRASVRANGSEIPLGADSCALSLDGTAVGFTTSDATVVPSDTNAAADVFLRAPLA